MRSYFSYSAWALHDACAAAYDYRYHKRLPSPSGPAADRGTMIHSKGEGFVKGTITGVPREFKLFGPEMQMLKRHKAISEDVWCADSKWKPCKDRDKWVVAKIDAHALIGAELIVVDYKSGRMYADKHEKQGELYAVIGAGRFPDLDSVHVEMWYTDQKGESNHGKVLTWDYTPEQIKDSRAKWTERGKKLLSAKKFPTNPGDACRWCAFGKSVGGPCRDDSRKA